MQKKLTIAFKLIVLILNNSLGRIIYNGFNMKSYQKVRKLYRGLNADLSWPDTPEVCSVMPGATSAIYISDKTDAAPTESNNIQSKTYPVRVLR